jgi:hypothetical protein
MIQYAVVVLWEGTGLSIQLRRVRFPSTAPIRGIHILGIMPALHVGQKSSILLSSTSIIFHSSTAVVQQTVNLLVVGSIPTCGANLMLGHCVMVAQQTLTLLV